MSDYNNLQEEELKLVIAEQFFAQYDCKPRIGKIDFCVTQIQDAKHVIAGEARLAPTEGRETVSLLWAEAKRGIVSDLYKPLVQLILTIGKARTFETYLPPPFLAAFDAEKIAFIPYKDILPFFALNDFNWNVTPSDEKSREFGLLYATVKDTLERTSYIFRYDAHEAELREFIKQHLSESSELIQINKNNFVSIYQRWLAQVQPSISVNWEGLKKQGIIDGDFFLADLLSEKNQTIKDALYVLLQDNRYILGRKMDINGLFTSSEVTFNDRQKAHTQFWSLYQRPPHEEYWDYIIERRDLLVPQDVREREGSFFTPKIWVDLSQKYLADVLGENWQEEYYIWDCAAGTGNLLNGLTNKYNIWASTLDQQDVDVMKDRIKNGANLLESHVFQFDFLNDEFDCGKLPDDLLNIIQSPEERRKLVVYINPPYAEAGNSRTPAKTGANRAGIATSHTVYQKYLPQIGKAAQELFALFIIRIFSELKIGYIAHFSTPKILLAPNFSKFRDTFSASFCTSFFVPAYTFDNVVGSFPVGFFIWNLKQKRTHNIFRTTIYKTEGNATIQRSYFPINRTINHWRITFPKPSGEIIGYLEYTSSDLQHHQTICINSSCAKRHTTFVSIDQYNFLLAALYFSVRISIPHSWDRHYDQFLYPKDGWQKDTEFQNNCLTFILFHVKNFITYNETTNHWIPFTEGEVNVQARYKSHFMTDFIAGKIVERKNPDQNKTSLRELNATDSIVPTEPLVFSPEAIAVFDAGRELWRYYHAQPNANPNASYYDIREYFQGRNENGKMNPKSEDAEYMRLLGKLKDAMEVLRQQIVPKVYEYGFLIA